MRCKRIISFLAAFMILGGSLDITALQPVTAEAKEMNTSVADYGNGNINDHEVEQNDQDQSGVPVVNQDQHSEYEFADYVVQIPQETDVHIDENNTVTINNSTVDISIGDTFVVYEGTIPCVYLAENVTKDGSTTVITTSEADKANAITGMDVYEDIDIDLSNFVPAEGFEVVSQDNNPGDVELFSARDSSGSSITVVNKSVPISDGLSASVNAEISNLKFHQEANNSKASISVTGDVKTSASFKFDGLGSVKNDGYNKLFLGGVDVPGIGYAGVYVNLACEGKFEVKWSGSFEAGISYYAGQGVSTFGSLEKKSCDAEVKVNLLAGITAEFKVNVAFFSGKIWATAGLNCSLTDKIYGDGLKPTNCATESEFLYANYGAKATFNVLTYKKEFGRQWDIYDENNSPLKNYHHWEDGKDVSSCTRGDDINKYLPWSDSYEPYYEVPSAYNAGSGGGRNPEPYSIFEYETLEDSDKLIKITGWCGNVSKITIPDTIDGYTVVEIDKNAFENNTVFRSVSIPDSVTKINEMAFKGCTNLSDISLSKNVTEIGYSAFENCISLSSIYIPKSLEVAHVRWDGLGINDYANDDSGIFTGCKNLKEVTFEKGTRKILANLFAFCNGVEQVTIPETVIEIGTAAFFECTNLKSVYMPDTITEINNDVFSGCVKLNEVKLSLSLTKIGENAFWGCAFSDVVIPDPVEHIGGGAFRDCSNLASVKLPKSLKVLNAYSFGNCDKLTDIIIPSGVIKCENYTYYNGWTTTYTKIGAFAGSDNLKTAVISDGAKTIASNLFRNSAVEKVTMPDSILEIGNFAFTNCKNLKNIRLSSNLYTIGDHAFTSCTSLENIDIPDSVEEMYIYIFSHCKSLRTAKLPNKRQNITEGTFYNCEKLERVEVPDTVIAVRESAFENCKSLETFKVTDKLEIIESFAFKNSGINTIMLENSNALKEIQKEAFSGCTNLSNVVIPNTVDSIGTGAFKNCESLETVKLSNKLKTIPSEAFRYCYELSKVEIPASVTSIESKAFGENTSLSDVDFGKNVTEIASDAFSYPIKMTFYGYKDTYPQTYADEKGIKFVEKKEKYGDTNGDGEINGKDIIRLRKYLATYDESTGNAEFEIFPGADANGDGTVNGKDLIRLRRYLADYDDKTGQSSVTLGK